MRLKWVGSVAVACALLVGVPAASAESRAAAEKENEPRAGSPAGVIYQIPLDSARRDAAPVLHVGSHGGPGSPGDPSSIHSENGFGSSSQVPGVSQAALQVDGAFRPATSAPGSTWPTYLLIALVAAGAIGAGVLARGARRRRSEGAGDHPPDI